MRPEAWTIDCCIDQGVSNFAAGQNIRVIRWVGFLTDQAALCDVEWENSLVTKTKDCWTSQDEFLSVFHSI